MKAKDKKVCKGCQKAPLAGLRHYCATCGAINGRLKRKGVRRTARAGFLEFWGEKAGSCYLTGLKLDLKHRDRPLSLTVDHVVPGSAKHVMPAAAFINDMKSDLTDQEFKAVVISLAKYFKNPSRPFRIPAKVNFSHWNRCNG